MTTIIFNKNEQELEIKCFNYEIKSLIYFQGETDSNLKLNGYGKIFNDTFNYPTYLILVAKSIVYHQLHAHASDKHSDIRLDHH